jgi:GDP/UDP-N,N'-diacetylbacillosamine 2-epimerase (hydrolysing)
MKKIVAVTEGRMTYGLLHWTLKELEEHPDFELHVVATGSHLSQKHGMTISEIEKVGFSNLHKIESIVGNHDLRINIAKSMAKIIEKLSEIFEKIRPDAMMILGDRFELLAAANVCTVMNIPIIHICGGEISEGTFDEQIRHAITKLSHLHFAGCEEYKQNIIKLGENKNRIFDVGEPGVENISKLEFLEKEEVFEKLGINNLYSKNEKPVFLITYHPITLEVDGEQKIDSFISALSEFDAIKIITAPNQDPDGNLFLDKLNNYVKSNDDVYLFSSLGQLRYLSLMKICDVVIGNSSSGILETPSFKVPCINIGSRQQGRLRSENIIDCKDDKTSIVRAISKSLSNEFKVSINNMQSPFGNGSVSEKIVAELVKVDDYSKLMKKSLNWNQ